MENPLNSAEFRKSTTELIDLLLLNLADLIETPTDIEPELVDLYFCVKEFKTKEGL
jgi:hypothetical protein